MNDRNPHDPCLHVEAATFMIGSTTSTSRLMVASSWLWSARMGRASPLFSRSWRATSSPLAAGYFLMVGLSRTGRPVSSHSGAQS